MWNSAFFKRLYSIIPLQHNYKKYGNIIEWNEQNKYTNTWINKWKLRGGRKKPKIGQQIIWIPSDPPSLLGRFRITLAASGKRKKLDLLTSRAFERVARLWGRSAIVRARSASERARSASERKFVPGPTTPDQKTKRTTLRKSRKKSVCYTK